MFPPIKWVSDHQKVTGYLQNNHATTAPVGIFTCKFHSWVSSLITFVFQTTLGCLKTYAGTFLQVPF